MTSVPLNYQRTCRRYYRYNRCPYLPAMSMKDGTRYRRSRYRHSRNYVGNDMQGKQPLR